MMQTRTRLIRPRPQGAEVCGWCGYLENSTNKKTTQDARHVHQRAGLGHWWADSSLMVIRLQADNQLEHRHLAKNADKQLMMICTISAGNQCKT